MKKILDCEDSFVSREHLGKDNRLGIIFPNATGGHFLYTFYSYNPHRTLHTLRIDSAGTAHSQARHNFNTYSGLDENDVKKHKKRIIAGKKDFLAHYYDYNLIKDLYPDHFLIGITISPELMLLHTYMMVFKVMLGSEVKQFKQLLRQPPAVQYNKYQNFFDHFNNYRYCELNLTYTTKELYYDKTINPRLKKYRLLQRQYIDYYLGFFEKLQDYMSPCFRYQYNFEKEFIGKYRDTLDI